MRLWLVCLLLRLLAAAGASDAASEQEIEYLHQQLENLMTIADKLYHARHTGEEQENALTVHIQRYEKALDAARKLVHSTVYLYGSQQEELQKVEARWERKLRSWTSHHGENAPLAASDEEKDRFSQAKKQIEAFKSDFQRLFTMMKAEL
eukprot:gnl/TRDRNA2_/TRDRNA2_175085_c5_seq13.p1 gnl/TRDRNA2_/TRDRNA2_175085_c5~~gnl/TRDRNA2_/TRDRNA2_175085_c5_seq13.p1  ORF type:complete len:150 (+),score=39.12 gnl/TRDRNA2_/TRDRNA2_175085_c5_seq13:112-561(+)